MDTTPKKLSARSGPHCSPTPEEGPPPAAGAEDTLGHSPWRSDGEEIIAALRAFFLTHTLDPLTGEVHTVH